jgi:hypothetical protein
LRLLSFSPSARSASSATRVALQSRSRSLSLSERTEKPPFGGLFLLRNGHRPVRNPASPVFSPAPGPIRTARNGLSAVGRYGHGRTSRLPLGPLPRPIGRSRPWSARSCNTSTPAVSFAQKVVIAGRFGERVRSTRAGLEDRPYKRAGSARKRSFAKGVVPRRIGAAMEQGVRTLACGAQPAAWRGVAPPADGTPAS